jgi:hypothetical protein
MYSRLTPEMMMLLMMMMMMMMMMEVTFPIHQFPFVSLQLLHRGVNDLDSKDNIRNQVK